MSFVSYLYLILLINGQMFKIIVALEKFWELNGVLVFEGFFWQLVDQVENVTTAHFREIRAQPTLVSSIQPRLEFAKRGVRLYNMGKEVRVGSIIRQY